MFWLEVWDYLTLEERRAFERNPEVKYQMEARRCFAKYFQYDPKVYDKHHYKLQMLQSNLRKQAYVYHHLTIPYVGELRDDMDDDNQGGIILSASTKPIPRILDVFFQHYIENPSAKAMILSPSSLARFCQIQHSLLNRNLSKYARGSPLLLPYPMLYCVHIDPLNVDQSSYVAVLWYGCTPDDSEKNIYALEKYEADDKRLLQAPAAEEFIVSKAVILMGVAAQHWMREATSVGDALVKLTECYSE